MERRGLRADRRGTGLLLGSLVPDGVIALDFALTALFAVLARDTLRDLRGDLPTSLPRAPCR